MKSVCLRRIVRLRQLLYRKLQQVSVLPRPICRSPNHQELPREWVRLLTDMKKSYALREEHLETVLQEYERFSKEYIKIKKRGEDFHFFHYMIDLDEGPCLAKRSVGCGAGTEYISVTPSGDIYPCHQFVGEKKFILGNIYEGIKNREIPKEFSSANVFVKEDCSKCWAKFYCSGGCHANTFLLGILAIIILFIVWYQGYEAKKIVDKFLFSLPVIGNLRKKTTLTSYTHTLGMLMQSGVPMIDSLSLSAEMIKRVSSPVGWRRAPP